MEAWAEIRRRVLTGEISKRQACQEYDIHWQTLHKILTHEEPPGFRTRTPRAKPRLGPFLPIIQQILEDDRHAPKSSGTPPSASSNASATSTPPAAVRVLCGRPWRNGGAAVPRCSCRSHTRPAKPRGTSATPKW